MQDFPAAHSMDTTWFAIDADGCVARFTTNEGGAVPKEFPETKNENTEKKNDLVRFLTKESRGIIQQIQPLNIQTVLEYVNANSLEDIQDRICRFEGMARLNPQSRSWYDDIEELILILSREQAIQDLKLQSRRILRFADERIIVHVDKCDREWLKRSIESGLVLAARDEYLTNNLSWLGLYEYNAWGNSVPYQRSYLLKEPIHLKNLPPEVADSISYVSLSVRFSENEFVQPIEHMPCDVWDKKGGWVDTDDIFRERFPVYP
jgi:hypothetical protein